MIQRTWFITGVNSGLGRHMTEQLLVRGDRVAGTLRKPGAVDDLKAEHGDRLWLASLDVTDTAAIRSVVGRAFAELGRIDVVINNAGYGAAGAAEELTDAQIDHQIATNLVGSIQVVRAVTPHLRAQGGGRIIQISSMGGQVAFPAGSLYHTTKWGIEGFIESVSHELAPFNIGVTIIEPGSTGTHFGRNLVVADPIEAYADGPVGRARNFFGSGTYASPGEVRVRISAIGVNRFEALYRRNHYVIPANLPSAMGVEAVERIAEIGPDVPDRFVGERVTILPLGAPIVGSGTYATHANVPAFAVIPSIKGTDAIEDSGDLDGGADGL